jgi:hypothetical protein
MYQSYIGIDPGKNGGLAYIVGTTVGYDEMYDTDLETWAWLDGVDNSNTFAMIEKVHAMPKQGVTSTFTFGVGYGKLLMALCAAGIAYEEVTPRTWQKGLGIKPRGKTETKPKFKNRLRKKAQQLFPQEKVWQRTLGEQRAVCDALLIAEYNRRKQKGIL